MGLVVFLTHSLIAHHFHYPVSHMKTLMSDIIHCYIKRKIKFSTTLLVVVHKSSRKPPKLGISFLSIFFSKTFSYIPRSSNSKLKIINRNYKTKPNVFGRSSHTFL